MPQPKKPRGKCRHCGKDLQLPAPYVYCDNHCQMEHQYHMYVERWLAGLESGHGPQYKLSTYVRRWMSENYGEYCSICGWTERHPVTGRSAVTVHHIDGDVANCRPENLCFLCPNHHSLTENFGALNRGNGKRPTHKGEYFRRRRGQSDE